MTITNTLGWAAGMMAATAGIVGLSLPGVASAKPPSLRRARRSDAHRSQGMPAPSQSSRPATT